MFKMLSEHWGIWTTETFVILNKGMGDFFGLRIISSTAFLGTKTICLKKNSLALESNSNKTKAQKKKLKQVKHKQSWHYADF